MQQRKLEELQQGLTKKEILQKIPNLPQGSINYWILKCQIFPIGQRPARHGGVADLYPRDSADRIKAAFDKREIMTKREVKNGQN